MSQGWRKFKCPDCGTEWKETCRDYQSQSMSLCVNDDCTGMFSMISPERWWEDTGIPVDGYGNLLETVVERLTKEKVPPTMAELEKKAPELQTEEEEKDLPMPYIDRSGREVTLVIPCFTYKKYKWWAGGQSIYKTLVELGAEEKLIETYCGKDRRFWY